jgi:hypothetical protein
MGIELEKEWSLSLSHSLSLRSPPQTGAHYVVQALELSILLPQAPERWDYRCDPPCLAKWFFFCAAGDGTQGPELLSKGSTTELPPQLPSKGFSVLLEDPSLR